eukprot:7932989-Pyramimonas_sp.AAC.1
MGPGTRSPNTSSTDSSVSRSSVLDLWDDNSRWARGPFPHRPPHCAHVTAARAPPMPLISSGGWGHSFTFFSNLPLVGLKG